MAYDEISYPVTTAISFGSSFVVNYPSGRTSDDYDAATGRHVIYSQSKNPLELQAGGFSLTLGASSATITITTSIVYVAGETLYVNLETGGTLDERVADLEAWRTAGGFQNADDALGDVVDLGPATAANQFLAATGAGTLAWLSGTTARTALGLTAAAVADLLDEDNMASNSATAVPSQQSVKAYVDAAVKSATTYIGGYNAATNTPDLDTSPSGISLGDTYVVTDAGTFFTASVDVGDLLIATQDSPTLESHWTIVEAAVDAATIKTRYESNSDTNAFTDALLAKLNAIEASADVTDTANVTAAGALMDSEVASLSGLKTLVVPDSTTITAWARTFLSDTDAGSARSTLGLGTGATATVQTSDTDTTAGRLMAVGAFGLGAEAPNVTDLTTDLQSGFYRFTENTATGSPGSSAYQCSLAVIRTTNGTMFYAQRQTAVLANMKAWHGSRTALTGAITWAEIAIEGQSPEFAGLMVSGNIAVTGTVDGRDVAAMGTKLDGIESGATADQTAAEILTAIKTVDGAASGLDADLLDGKQGADYVLGDATDNGTVIITANDANFSVRDSTDPVTDFIRRNHSLGVLYLGTAAAVPTLRANFDFNDYDLIDAGEISYQGGLKSFASRAALVTWVGSNTPVNAAAYFDGSHWYIGQTSATAISDLPGLIPAHPYHFDQWGITRETNTGQSTSAIDNATKIQAAIDWLQENGGGTLYTGAGVIAWGSTLYMGDGTFPVLLQGEGRGTTGLGKADGREAASTRFLWTGSATAKGFVLTSDRNNSGLKNRNFGGGVLDIFFDGGEIGTAATSIGATDAFNDSSETATYNNNANGGWLFCVISHNGHRLRIHLAYNPGGLFLSTCLSNSLASGPADNQRSHWDIWTSDANTTAEPYAHVLITGWSDPALGPNNGANTSLMEYISMNLRPESTAIAAHIEFSDGSFWGYIDASTRATKSGDGGKVILHADDTLSTYHGGAYSSQGHARRHGIAYEQIKSGIYALATVAGTKHSGPNTIHTHSRGNGSPAPTIEKGAILNYWDEETGVYTNDFLTVREFNDTTSITHGIKLEKVSTAGTTGMGLAKIQWRFTNDAGTTDVDAGRFNAVVRDPAAGAEDVRIGVVPMWGGSEAQTAMYWENGVVVPDGVASPTAQGFGTVNVAAGYYVDNTRVVAADGGYIFPVYTAAQIADITHAVNTTGKVAGKAVWDDTNNRLMIAKGSAAGGNWHVADGSASVTPS